MIFTLLLISLTVLSGLIAALDRWYWQSRRALAEEVKDKKMPLVADYARSFFPVLLVVLILRSFVMEPFRIPSASMEPTLLVGDFILVNKMSYGLELPLAQHKLVTWSTPQRGDVVVLRWPVNPAEVIFIKRIIGLPGDHISYQQKQLTINGQKVPEKFLKVFNGYKEDDVLGNAKEYRENLLGVEHLTLQNPQLPAQGTFHDLVVPKGMYFVMGDNRDNSEDSRYWGFVPQSAIIGRAFLVWMSWNSATSGVQWHRIGNVIH